MNITQDFPLACDQHLKLMYAMLILSKNNTPRHNASKDFKIMRKRDILQKTKNELSAIFFNSYAENANKDFS